MSTDETFHYKEETDQLISASFDEILLELEAIEKLASREESQALNERRASNLKVGLPINFGSHPKLEYKRIVL